MEQDSLRRQYSLHYSRNCSLLWIPKVFHGDTTEDHVDQLARYMSQCI